MRRKLDVLRPRRQDKDSVVRLLARLAPVLEAERIRGLLWVASKTGVRVRGEE